VNTRDGIAKVRVAGSNPVVRSTKVLVRAMRLLTSVRPVRPFVERDARASKVMLYLGGVESVVACIPITFGTLADRA